MTLFRANIIPKRGFNFKVNSFSTALHHIHKNYQRFTEAGAMNAAHGVHQIYFLGNSVGEMQSALCHQSVRA